MSLVRWVEVFTKTNLTKCHEVIKNKISIDMANRKSGHEEKGFN